MISKQIDTVDYMSCRCGKHPRMMETRSPDGPRYHMESLCCETVTVKFRSEARARAEYQRIRAAQYIDDNHKPMQIAGKFLPDAVGCAPDLVPKPALKVVK